MTEKPSEKYGLDLEQVARPIGPFNPCQPIPSPPNPQKNRNDKSDSPETNKEKPSPSPIPKSIHFSPEIPIFTSDSRFSVQSRSQRSRFCPMTTRNPDSPMAQALAALAASRAEAMAELAKTILARPIQLCDQVNKVADESSSFKADCAELKAKTERLAALLLALLRQAARAGSNLYERPTRRIVDEAEQALEDAMALVLKCQPSAGPVKRLFTFIPAAAFKKAAAQLENSIGDVSWILAVSAPDHRDDDDYLGLPPVAANEPILCMMWESIDILAHSGSSLDARAEAAASLASLAENNERYGKLIIEEGGVQPLLKLLKDAPGEGQEIAAKALRLLARDPESVDALVMAGVCLPGLGAGQV